MLDDSGHVGGNEVPLVAVAQDQRAILPGGDEGVGVIGADDAKGVGTLDAPQDTAHGLQHTVAFLVMEFQQLRHHLGIRFGGEGHAMAEQKLLDLQIVFNDAVMNQGDVAAFADMGVGVDVVGFAVGGPAGVANAEGALHISSAMDHVGQGLQTALCLFHLQAKGLRTDGDTGGVVTAILHPCKSVQQNRGRLLSAHKSNDSTHKQISL